jgi:hypothetical protein
MSDQEKERIRAIFPGATDEQLLEIRERLNQYAELAWEIFRERRQSPSTEIKQPKPLPRNSLPKRVDSIYRKFDSFQGCPGAEESA